MKKIFVAVLFVLLSVLISKGAFAANEENDSIFGRWTCTVSIYNISATGTGYFQGSALNEAEEKLWNKAGKCSHEGLDIKEGESVSTNGMFCTNVPEYGNDVALSVTVNWPGTCTYKCTEDDWYYLTRMHWPLS